MNKVQKYLYDDDDYCKSLGRYPLAYGLAHTYLQLLSSDMLNYLILPLIPMYLYRKYCCICKNRRILDVCPPIRNKEYYYCCRCTNKFEIIVSVRWNLYLVRTV